MSIDKQDKDKAKELILIGTEIAGAAASGAAGFFASDPTGAAASAMAGPLITQGLRIVADFAYRSLSRKEKVRVGAGIAFAIERIERYRQDGHQPRDDGFFARDSSDRSTSDEILEGVLFKCKNEYEEKKTRFLGYIYASVAYMENVSPANAYWLLQIAESLTYRQLCIIALAGRKSFLGGPSLGPADGDPAFQAELRQLLDLKVFRIQYFKSEGRVIGYLDTDFQERDEIRGLSRIGQLFYRVMGLDEVPDSDLQELKSHFPRAFNLNNKKRAK